MDSFKKNRLGEDGTFKDFCKWYGGDCGDCFPQTEGTPDCFEPHVENEPVTQPDRAKRPAG